MANPANSLPSRGSTFTALLRVDRPGAVNALLTGFTQLQAQERVQVVNHLQNVVGGEEGRMALARIAANDPDEGVRRAAGAP